MKRYSLFLFFFLATLSIPVFGQKKALDHDSFDGWESVKKSIINDRGDLLIYSIEPQEGDGTLHFINLKNNKKLSVERGHLPAFSAEHPYAFCLIKPLYQQTRRAKIDKKKGDKFPQDSLAIINLKEQSIERIANVQSFKIGKKGDLMAYMCQLEEAQKADSTNTPQDSTKVAKKKAKKPKITKNNLIVIRLNDFAADTLKNVDSYSFSEKGDQLIAKIKVLKKDTVNTNCIIRFAGTDLKRDTIDSGKKHYFNYSWSENEDLFTFAASNDTIKEGSKETEIYFVDFNHRTDSLIPIVTNSSLKGLPKNRVISEYRTPSFSFSGKRLLFGITDYIAPKDTTIPDFEKADLDIWSYFDEYVQPAQLLNRSNDLKYSDKAFIELNAPKQYRQLSDKNLRSVYLARETESDWALAIDDSNGRIQRQWRGYTVKDLYEVNLNNGEKRVIKKELHGYPFLSPMGKFAVWYDQKEQQYFAYEMGSGKEPIDISSACNVPFYDVENETPSMPNPYGFMGWKEQDERIYIYDQFDIWEIDPLAKQAPVCITNGIGRSKKYVLRNISLDKDKRFFYSGDKLLLSSFDKTSKKNGFYSLILSKKPKIKELLMSTHSYSRMTKAKDAEKYIFIRSNFIEEPNLFVANKDLKTMRQITNINQENRAKYLWGQAPELMKWTTYDGKESEGILYKPENFDPTKKYPVMIYFYEKHSDGLYEYITPQPSWSIINITFYCSRGYLVFSPDIHYTDGHPGRSCYNSLMSGVDMLVKNNWVDSTKMAIQGQSWGGYQVAYMVTQTGRFAAAGAGAPVSNMTSAYGGIRWESGNSRQSQYEHGQSRIGKDLWEGKELYYENSPIFFVKNVTTPLLIMHNDKDGAVPWYQGIELFMGLRRLEKPVWMLQYNNEAHNLRLRKNRKDLTIRLQQFFDHYLKGAPAPVWMTEGRPATLKGYSFGTELSGE